MKNTMSHDQWMAKLALGTVQFGLDYGISNDTGKVSISIAEEILRKAHRDGIATLDTASAYGNSEEILGSLLKTTGLPFEVITKLRPGTEPQSVASEMNNSLALLKTEQVSGLLLHQFSDIKTNGMLDAMIELRETGQTVKIGVSVYYPEEVEWLLENDLSVDLIQLPLNIFDQRFVPLFPDLKSRGVEIHARSVFLQGLFFIPPEKLSTHFDSVRQSIIDIRKRLDSIDIPMGAFLLNYVMNQHAIDKVVIGVTCLEELDLNIGSYNYFDRCRSLHWDTALMKVSDESIILPFNWS